MVLKSFQLSLNTDRAPQLKASVRRPNTQEHEQWTPSLSRLTKIAAPIPRAGHLILSVAGVVQSNNAIELVVGRVGVPNVERTLRVGGVVLFDTVYEGLFEVRILRLYYDSGWRISLRVSRLEPLSGVIAGLGSEEITNTPFRPAEQERIRASIEAVQAAVTQRRDITPEQQDYINRKLDEIIEAGSRLGRRDWVNLAVGTLTNVVVNIGLGSGPARFLFQATADALAWLVGETLRLLS